MFFRIGFVGKIILLPPLSVLAGRAATGYIIRCVFLAVAVKRSLQSNVKTYRYNITRLKKNV